MLLLIIYSGKFLAYTIFNISNPWFVEYYGQPMQELTHREVVIDSFPTPLLVLQLFLVELVHDIGERCDEQTDLKYNRTECSSS